MGSSNSTSSGVPGDEAGRGEARDALRIDVLTIFPEMVTEFSAHSLIGKAARENLLDLRVHDIRDATDDVHRTVDDAPFGGGAGMVMKPEPIFATVERVEPPRPILLLGPGGRRLDQSYAEELASGSGFTLLCGRYEGIDARVHDNLVDGELSIGDYVLSGGEVAAMVVIETVGRLIPGVMGNDGSASEESFSEGLLEYPQYTRPAEFKGLEVPEVLRSGDHGRIRRWRLAKSLEKTIRVRPDLIEARGGLSPAEQKVLDEFSSQR